MVVPVSCLSLLDCFIFKKMMVASSSKNCGFATFAICFIKALLRATIRHQSRDLAGRTQATLQLTKIYNLKPLCRLC